MIQLRLTLSDKLKKRKNQLLKGYTWNELVVKGVESAEKEQKEIISNLNENRTNATDKSQE